MLRVLAPAKINLFLHVGGKRADGYHDLDSLVAFADVGDELTFENSDRLSLTIDGPFAGALADEKDNLVLRAARGVARLAKRELPRRIALTKNLPVASGIGGGSADAGATIRAFLLEWPGDEIKLSDFADLAGSLGADVPACFFGQNAWMGGRGDEIERCDVPEHHAVLINPGVSLSTRAVFAGLSVRSGTGNIERPNGFESAHALIEYLASVRNDLEAPARAMAPQIGDVLSALSQSGALLSRMSGSGATCFGLFDNDESAKAAKNMIARTHPGWWVVDTTLAKITDQ